MACAIANIDIHVGDYDIADYDESGHFEMVTETYHDEEHQGMNTFIIFEGIFGSKQLSESIS